MQPFGQKNGPTPQQLRKQLHEITGRSLTVIRCEPQLVQALNELEELEQALQTVSLGDSQRVYNQQWRQYLELRNMLPTARAITKSALLRRESRGVHIRSDYLTTDNDQCLHNIVLSGSQLQAQRVPAVLTKCKPEAGTWRYTEYLEHIVDTMD